MNKNLTFFFLLFICIQSLMASSYSKKRNTANSLEYSLDINLTHYLELLTKNKSA